MTSLHDFTMNRLDGTAQSLSDYADQVVLVVNTASECGLTPQYAGLQDLHTELSDQKFEVLGFPCNQFGAQEPGSAEQIQEFCQTQYSVTFPMFEKIEVNGEGAHPLYQWLRSQDAGSGDTDAIQWNFEKFLVGPDGQVIKRYAPTTEPAALKGDIAEALGA